MKIFVKKYSSFRSYNLHILMVLESREDGNSNREQVKNIYPVSCTTLVTESAVDSSKEVITSSREKIRSESPNRLKK